MAVNHPRLGGIFEVVDDLVGGVGASGDWEGVTAAVVDRPDGPSGRSAGAAGGCAPAGLVDGLRSGLEKKTAVPLPRASRAYPSDGTGNRPVGLWAPCRKPLNSRLLQPLDTFREYSSSRSRSRSTLWVTHLFRGITKCQAASKRDSTREDA